MHRTLALALASLLALPVATALPAHAHQATQQTTQPATTQPLQARITGVEGLVQVRNEDTQPWERAAVGMIVGEGAEFRTGPRSAVRFQLPPDQTITLDRLGTVKLVEAVASVRGIKTDLGMRYGRVRYDIEAAGVSHDATIHSPGSTLAVRGTQVSLTDTAPFPPVATSLTGKARYTSSKGKTIGLGDSQKATVENGDAGAAETEIENSYVDPTLPGTRSEDEQTAIMNQPRLSTFLTSPAQAWRSMPQARTPLGPPPVQLTRGSLIFQLVWIHSQTSATTPDVDLYVLTPAGEALCPKECLPTVPTGGRSPADDTGGGNLQTGQEIAAWQSRFPLGNYRYQVRHVSGDPAEFQVVVVRDGQLVGQPVSGSVAGGGRQNFNLDVRGTNNSTSAATKQAKRERQNEQARPLITKAKAKRGM